MKEHKYRADIDGLRALSVIPIVLYHAFPKAIRGGFIGVDVFFVISGYLISSIIMASLEANNFSYREFYARRIKRIFPALLIVLSCVSAAGWFLLTATEYQQVLKHIAGGASFSANILLWRENGYFDTDAALKPLLHLWSLGIEEQFYILWPPVLVFLFTRRLNYTILAAALLAASFSLNVFLSYRSPVVDFYLLPTRFWELMCGFLLSRLDRASGGEMLSALRERLGGRAHHLASLFGFLLIIVGILALRREDPFPGWRAAIPVLGAVMLIGAGREACVNRFLLSSRFMVWVGLISYPLYLWHWPLLSFARSLEGEKRAVGIRLGLVALSLLLSWTTYMLVERPVRLGGNSRVKTLVLVALMTIMGLFGAYGYWQKGLPSRFPEEIRELAAPIDFEWPRYARMGQCHIQEPDADRRDPVCMEPGHPMIAIWGDSDAASLYPGLKKLQESRHYSLSQVTQAGCPPIFDLKTLIYKKNCNVINQTVLAQLKLAKPDVVILHAAWKHEHYPMTDDEIEAKFGTTLDEMRLALPSAHFIVIGPVPRWEASPQKTLLKSWMNEVDKTKRVKPYQPAEQLTDIDSLLKRIAEAHNARFISAIGILCRADGCLAYVGPKPTDIIATDMTHFSRAGSEYFVGKINDALP